MSDSPAVSTARGKPLDLQDLALLNQEIAALVRAGVPLESGLAFAGEAGEGSQELLMLRLAQRLREGRTFAEALHIEGGELPQLYRAVIEAGARSGRLPEALESLANFSQHALQLRRRIDLALLYPALVVLLVSLLFVGLVEWWIPSIVQTFHWMQLPEGNWLQRLGWLRENLWTWSWIAPLLVVTFGIWWSLTTRGRFGLKGTTDANSWSAFQVLPGIRSILANYRRANFCEVLAMLLQHQVPLPEAAPLAADASGDESLQRVAARIADGVRSGHSLADCLVVGRELPPFLTWMLVNGDRQGNLTFTLKQVAEVLRQRATSQSDWLRIMLPTFLVVVIGGGAVLIYSVTVFGTMSHLLQAIGAFNR